MRTLSRLMLLAAIMLLTGCGTSMLRSSCAAPRVSNLMAPSSYMVMLPYRYRGQQATHALDTERVNHVIGLQALRIAADMRDTHITIVEGDAGDPRCDVDAVVQRVVDDRNRLLPWRRAFHSVVFLWGEVYDGDDGLVVQTHMRTYWNGHDDRRLNVTLDRPYLVREFRFAGDLPDLTLSFPPHIVRTTAFDGLRGSLDVREQPNDGAQRVELPRQFVVGRWHAPWLSLTDKNTGRTVWLRVPDDFGTVGDLMPELTFARALTAYFNYRVLGDRMASQQVTKALHDFHLRVGSAPNPLLRAPRAMAHALQATLGLGAPDPASDAGNSTELFDRAADAFGARADWLNLAAMSQMGRCCEPAAGMTPEVVMRTLEAAYRADPSHIQVRANLERWYDLMLMLPRERRAFDDAEIRRRQRALRQSEAVASLG